MRPETGLPDLSVTTTGTRTRSERVESLAGTCGGAAGGWAKRWAAMVKETAKNRAIGRMEGIRIRRIEEEQ